MTDLLHEGNPQYLPTDLLDKSKQMTYPFQRAASVMVAKAPRFAACVPVFARLPSNKANDVQSAPQASRITTTMGRALPQTISNNGVRETPMATPI